MARTASAHSAIHCDRACAVSVTSQNWRITVQASRSFNCFESGLRLQWASSWTPARSVIIWLNSWLRGSGSGPCRCFHGCGGQFKRGNTTQSWFPWMDDSKAVFLSARCRLPGLCIDGMLIMVLASASASFKNDWVFVAICPIHWTNRQHTSTLQYLQRQEDVELNQRQRLVSLHVIALQIRPPT